MSRNWILAFIFAAALALPVGAQQSAHADLLDAKGDKVGSANLEQTANGVRISLTASHLPAGMHGFHIHSVGKCKAPDFKSAGGHFNPAGKKHGAKNPDGAHNGDLGNVTADADGNVKATLLAKDVTLGDGASSLFHPDGTSLVIHAGPDDEATDPAGNSGARVACGIIHK